MEVTLLFGSNQGDRQALIRQAMQQMTVIGPIKCSSSLYETAPWGFEADNAFYNIAVTYTTALSPTDVLHHCLETEKQLGRTRPAGGYASRTMDIDIILYDQQVISTPELTIPHPRMALRNFVHIPLNEIMPEYIHPVTHRTIASLLQSCPDTLKVHPIQQ